MIWTIIICFSISVGLIGAGLAGKAALTRHRNRAGIDRQQWPEETGAYDTNPPQELDYNYIEWLEARLKVGKFDPDRIEMFGPPEGDSAEALNARIAHKMAKVREARGIREMNTARRELRRAEAESRLRAERLDYITGEARGNAKFKTGGVLRTYIDKDGNQTTIRSFGG